MTLKEMGRRPYTVEDVEKFKVRQTAHLDGPRGPKGWFGDMQECIQEPRLQRRVRYWRATRSHDMTWYVDGKIVGEEGKVGNYFPTDLLAAALNKPPELNLDERTVLALVGEEYRDMRREVDVLVLLSLRSKGQVDMLDGKVRLRKERWVV